MEMDLSRPSLASHENLAADREAPASPIMRFDGVLMHAILAPLDMHRAQEALVRQQALDAPAKLAVSPDGTAIFVAEVPANDNDIWCTEQMRRASEAGRAWFDQRTNGAPKVAPSSAMTSDVEKVLTELECTWTVGDAGTYRVHGLDIPSVLLIELLAGDTFRVSYPTTAIRAAVPASREAMALFALEANARLRFARMSIAPAAAALDVVHVGWDAMVFGGRYGDHWLAEAVAAVSVAHAETSRVVRALASDCVARSYLQARDPRYRANGEVRRPRVNGKA